MTGSELTRSLLRYLLLSTDQTCWYTLAVYTVGPIGRNCLPLTLPCLILHHFDMSLDHQALGCVLYHRPLT